MAYDKHTWTCNEPITVERLNHIEDGIANAGGDCDCGYSCETTVTELTEETVTTEEIGTSGMATLTYSELIDAESIKVTFNGTEYECPKSSMFGAIAYGGVGQSGPDFSQYPFVIGSSGVMGNRLVTETAGTYTIKIEAVETTVTTSSCFDKARGYGCDSITLTEETLTATRVEDI